MTSHPFKRVVAAILLAGALFSHAGLAEAQQFVCVPREEIVSWLGENYDERPFGYGLAGHHVVVEIHVSPNGSWTVLTTFANGRSCLVFSGHSWTVPVPPASLKAP